MAKNLTLIFNHFEKEHLGKDVFLVPYTIGKKYGFDVTIVYPLTKTNSDFPSEINGVKLHPIKPNKRKKWLPIWRTLPFYLYLLRNAKKIDLLMRIHHQDHTYFQTFLYKLLNRKGFLYLKSDGFPNSFRKAIGHNSKLSWWRRKMFNMFVDKVDRVSIEKINDYNYMVRHGSSNFVHKLRYMPNGFDEEELKKLSIKERDFSEKENLIITVGRLGNYDKNTELILDALEGADLKDWRIELIGPIEAGFKSKIEDFFRRNPENKEKIKFTGPVYDKADLWEHYNRAKVFILSSRKEGYPLVFGEARRFRCFIISTDVGAAKDVTESGKFGHIINVGDCNSLREEIISVIEGKTNINVYSQTDTTSMAWDKLIDKLDLNLLIKKSIK